MSRPGVGIKRKRDELRSQTEARKRRAIQNNAGAVPDLERIETCIEEEPSKNREEMEHLIRLFDSSHLDAKSNMKIGVSLFKIFSRFVASGYLSKNGGGSKQNQEGHDWYLQQYDKYRAQPVKLLRTVPPTQRFSMLHLCWKVLEQDAELFDNSIWASDSLFKPLLSAVIEIPDGTDVREIFVGEYMDQCHDCCYHSLEHFSYVDLPSASSIPNVL
jgi:hypothetical protein